jgi:acetolactate synthase I/II/III large subunit
VADALVSGRRPTLIAGNGVHRSRAYAELAGLAEALALPVVTTAGGKGSFAESHPLALGVFGNFGGAAANAAVAESDVLLVVGSKLSPSDTANENPALIDPVRQAIVQVDLDERNTGWTYPAAEVLLADAALALDHLRSAQRGISAEVRADRQDRVKALRERHGYFVIPAASDPSELSEAPALISQLSDALPESAIVCADAGENRIFLTHYFQTKSADSFIQPSGVGAMGYAVPAAMAAKLAFPSRLAVAVCGDGGFAMAMNGLLTAVEEHIPIVVVILNNSCLGWVYHGQRGRSIASEFDDFDFAAIAREMGCVSFRTSTVAEFRTAIDTAIAQSRPAVIDARVARTPTFLDVTSPFVRR